jgi:hypothetical protein
MGNRTTVTIKEIREAPIPTEDILYVIAELQNYRKNTLAKLKRSKSIEYRARKLLGDKSNRPVKIFSNESFEPRWAGESFHYETRGGQRIYYPSAYSKRGWSNMIYCYSTLHIEVGANWKA